VVRLCEQWLEKNYREPGAIAGVVKASGIPERSLKRRFKMATGSTLIGHIQNLRIEEAKHLLETASASFEQISAEVGYENLAFFRRLFKRSTGLTPGQYRRMFRPFSNAADIAAAGGT
jgi:transcriptional regulator GlxA family with amidase domain